jgi:hypothetical protein
VLAILKRAELVEKIGPDFVQINVAEAVAAIRLASAEAGEGGAAAAAHGVDGEEIHPTVLGD